MVERQTRAASTARQAMTSSAKGLDGQQLESGVRSPLAFMRKKDGSVANIVRGRSQSMAWSSCSTWMP